MERARRVPPRQPKMKRDPGRGFTSIHETANQRADSRERASEQLRAAGFPSRGPGRHERRPHDETTNTQSRPRRRHPLHDDALQVDRGRLHRGQQGACQARASEPETEGRKGGRERVRRGTRLRRVVAALAAAGALVRGPTRKEEVRSSCTGETPQLPVMRSRPW